MKNSALTDAIVADYTKADLELRPRAIMDYAVKLTRHPGEMERDDVARLREAGLDDGEILDVCQVTAYYNYVNRLADGLGVELEWYWERIPDPPR